MFARNPSPIWHETVPGARWFRADLHLHTLDDAPGGRIAQPNGERDNPAVQKAYAREFLRTAVVRGIEVLGLTPHCTVSGRNSATWAIIDEWNTGSDDDGIPFRNKIYAIFPGFEPSISDGKAGVHLLFLFDPEVGEERYQRLFTTIMGGVAPWNGNQLVNSRLSAVEVFEQLDGIVQREAGDWGWICLAPHVFSDKGLFQEMRAQIMADFPVERISAFELGDNQTPEDGWRNRPWLKQGMAERRHVFYHASDAYTLNSNTESAELFELGSRSTMLKLAEPRIEALRQAFLAGESRLRLAFGRDPQGNFGALEDLPSSNGTNHPWLRSVTVRGGTSFFGGIDAAGNAVEQVFRLSPGLTCLIGGRMAGKSTFLDGLRVHQNALLPREKATADDVSGRASERFLSGGAQIEVLFGGTAAAEGDWPAQFFTQRELQAAVDDQEGLRQILYNLAPGGARVLNEQHEQLATLDNQLRRLVPQIVAAKTAEGETAQAFQEADSAREAMGRHRDAGVDRLERAYADVASLESFLGRISELRANVRRIAGEAEKIALPEFHSDALREQVLGDGAVAKLPTTLVDSLGHSTGLLTQAIERVKAGRARAEVEATALKAEIERRLVESGGTPEELVAFDRLSAVAATYDARKEAADAASKATNELLASFQRTEAERTALVGTHRAEIAAVFARVQERFGNRIRISVVNEGLCNAFDKWIRDLRQQGITRWWNDRCERPGSSPPPLSSLLSALETDRLHELGMSPQVAGTFRETVTSELRLSLRALRNPDKYSLELLVGNGAYREMDKLSGGQQVSLLLSLLLETEDNRPLLIDQPEDELDNAFLFGTILPILRRLKGHRQIVFATHNANIVVNGDADQVIYLTADHEHGTVTAQGAIETPAVKQAIIDTVDGGGEAFKLRQVKYGY